MGEGDGKRERCTGRGTTLYYVCTWLPEGDNNFAIGDASDEQEANYGPDHLDPRRSGCAQRGTQ